MSGGQVGSIICWNGSYGVKSALFAIFVALVMLEAKSNNPSKGLLDKVYSVWLPMAIIAVKTPCAAPPSI